MLVIRRVQSIDGGQVSHDEFRRFCLPCTRLSRDDDGLTDVVPFHTREGIFSDGEQVRLKLALSSPSIGLDDFGSVKRHSLERIDSDEHDPGIGVDAVLRITILNGVQDCAAG